LPTATWCSASASRHAGAAEGHESRISKIIRRNAEAAAAALAVELVPLDAMFLDERRRIAALAAAARLPSMYAARAHVVDGGLG